LLSLEADAKAVVLDIKDKEFSVSSVEKNPKARNPLAPFITSTLQQDAFNKLRFGATKTMFIAQQLYEGIELGEEGPVGLITYMRTDSVQVAASALEEVRGYIQATFGKAYLPQSPRFYKSKKSAQQAHEAIRPTAVSRSPEALEKYLTPEQFRLYELIWKRFVACQMNPAQLEVMTALLRCEKTTFRAVGTTVVFDGFTTLYKVEDETEEEANKSLLPPLEKDELLEVLALLPAQHFTKPPARYSEGSLIKALEEEGVGRPSTYAPILGTIISRDYVRREKGYFMPTELGFKVTDILVSYFPQVMDITFTAHLEEELDLIEDGKMNWVSILNEFYTPFKEKLDFAGTDIKKEVIYSDEICSVCGKQMVIKWGRKGKFLSCSDYPKCKNAKSISSGVKCPAPGCGGDLILRRSYRGRSFYGCSNYPKCTFTSKDLPTAAPAEEAAPEKTEPSANDQKPIPNDPSTPNSQ
jgi:DNA topoisomerase-1